MDTGGRTGGNANDGCGGGDGGSGGGGGIQQIPPGPANAGGSGNTPQVTRSCFRSLM